MKIYTNIHNKIGYRFAKKNIIRKDAWRLSVRERNVPKCLMHVQSQCFVYYNYCFLTLSLTSSSSMLKVPNFKEKPH